MCLDIQGAKGSQRGAGESGWVASTQGLRCHWDQIGERFRGEDMNFYSERGERHQTCEQSGMRWLLCKQLALAVGMNLDWGQQMWKQGAQLGGHCNNPCGTRMCVKSNQTLGWWEKHCDGERNRGVKDKAKVFSLSSYSGGGWGRGWFWKEDEGCAEFGCVKWGWLSRQVNIWVWGSGETSGLKYTSEKRVKPTQAAHPTLVCPLQSYFKECFGSLDTDAFPSFRIKGDGNQYCCTMSQILSCAFKIHSLNVLKWYTVLPYWIHKGTTIHRAWGPCPA